MQGQILKINKSFINYAFLCFRIPSKAYLKNFIASTLNSFNLRKLGELKLLTLYRNWIIIAQFHWSSLILPKYLTKTFFFLWEGKYFQRIQVTINTIDKSKNTVTIWLTHWDYILFKAMKQWVEKEQIVLNLKKMTRNWIS